ncbi:MAG: oligosaccharide repeat unit polymerase [Candidatus Hydrothermarchaeales archaeon]
MIEESKIISFLSSATRSLKPIIEDSKAFEIVLSTLEFIENSYRHSKFKSLLNRILELSYIESFWNAFDSTNEKFKDGLMGKVEVFNPIFLFPLVYLAFLSISTYRISNLGLLSITIGLIFFVLGVVSSKRIEFGKIYLDEHSDKIAILFLALGTFYLVLDILRAGTIPILNPEARRGLSVLYTYIASLIVPGGILLISLIGVKLRRGEMSLREARMSAIAVTLGTTFLITLLGYRTQLVVSLLGCILAMYFMKLIGIAEIGVSSLAIVAAVSFVGYYRAITQGATLGVWEIIGGRIGLTLSVYDHLIDRFWVFGANRGSTLLATFSSFLPFIPGPWIGPRTIVARVFGVTHISMTSTLLGTIVLDFGIPGIIVFMFVLGFVVGMSYYAMRLTRSALCTAMYSLLIAYTLVGIETGLVDFNVAIFFIGSFLILYNSRKVEDTKLNH